MTGDFLRDLADIRIDEAETVEKQEERVIRRELLNFLRLVQGNEGGD